MMTFAFQLCRPRRTSQGRRTAKPDKDEVVSFSRVHPGDPALALIVERKMVMYKKLIVAGALVLGFATAASAQEGTVNGAAGGAVTGAIVGGPVGAAVGGVAGAG
jgi:hypothetical protein